jgi:hypothetical protein
MSSLPLTNFKHLLSMGPKFIPYQRIDPTNNEIISNFQSFTRNLKIKKHFYKKECLREIPFSYDNSWTRVIKLPSQWIPPLTHEQFEPFNNDLQLMEADFYILLAFFCNFCLCFYKYLPSWLEREVALHRGMGHCGYRRLEKFQTLLAAVVV